MAAYYNDIDPNACAWLRELMNENLIPDGVIDNRSIEEVSADDVREFTQCHWFAGIGGWAYALRLAGWSDARFVWSASLPCQPFSVAGKGLAQDDERHLFPVFAELVRECRPERIFGEQVSQAISLGWLDGVQDELEKEGYACGAIVLPACGIGAPHIRQRIWWVGDTSYDHGGRGVVGSEAGTGSDGVGGIGHPGSSGDVGVGDTSSGGLGELRDASQSGESGYDEFASGSGSGVGMADCDVEGLEGHPRDGNDRSESRRIDPDKTGSASQGSEPVDWSRSAWIHCRDGKSRRVPAESILQCMGDGVSPNLDGTRAEDGFPLAKGVKGRTPILKGYGNAIVPELACEFILVADEVIEARKLKGQDDEH